MRAIEPFVICKKTLRFSQTATGENASAVSYSIIETVKVNAISRNCYLSRKVCNSVIHYALEILVTQLKGYWHEYQHNFIKHHLSSKSRQPQFSKYQTKLLARALSTLTLINLYHRKLLNTRRCLQ